MNYEKEMEEFFLEKGDPAITQFVNKNLLITQQIFKYIHDRDWSQKDLANALGKSEAEISKWLSGVHNLTLKSLTRLETVLGEDIITTPLSARKQYEKVHFVKVKVFASINQPILQEDYPEFKEEAGPVIVPIRIAS